jgi:uncharacterized protein involved in outer membrane biogenesis
MKKIGIVLGILAGIVVLALVAAWLLLDVNRYRGLIQTQLEQKTGRQVTLGDMSLGLFPLRVQVQSPVIAEDPRFNQQSSFIRADHLAVQMSLVSLIRGNIQIDSVELRHPMVELIKDKQGGWNFSTFGAGAASAPSEARSGSAPAAGLTLDTLRILDGQIALTDLQQGRDRTVYDHIDLTLRNYRADQPFTFDLAAHIQGQGQQEVRIKGTAGPISDRDPAGTPLHATLALNQVSIDGLKKFLHSDPLARSEGVFSGESQLESGSGTLSASGKLKLDGARFNGVDIGYPILLDYKLAHSIEKSLLAIDSATIHFGQTPVSLNGSVNLSGATPVLNLKITSGDVSIAELSRLASAFGVAFAPGTTATGRVAANVQVTGSAAKPVLTGNIKASDLRISGQGVPQPVEVKTVELSLTPTDIRSNEFTATSGKTTVSARFAVKQYASDSPSIDAGVRAPNATLPEIQSIAKAYGVTGLDQLVGEGALNLDLRASGPVQSLDAASFTRALNGTINLDFSPLRMNGFDMANELAKIGGFSSGLAGQNFTDVVKLTGLIAVKNGIAQTDNLRAQLGIGNVGATGAADLAAETLNMKIAAIFSKDFSDKVGSTRIGGYMKTVLSNESGELVIPAIVTGSFKQPKFAPDVQAFAQMQKQRLLPSLKDPATALRGILGGLAPKAPPATSAADAAQTEQEQQQQQPAEKKTLKGILDGFLGGKKK